MSYCPPSHNIPFAQRTDGKDNVVENSAVRQYTCCDHINMALNEIKSAKQRVAKATEERDKLKTKLRKAQARLVVERERLRASEEKLES
jgi:hypothetical protein